jgi:CheY-like chemotaxis protein
VCRRLRSLPETQGTVIIAQTGWGQESDRQKAFEAGFDHHITKPISLDALNALLAQVKV